MSKYNEELAGRACCSRSTACIRREGRARVSFAGGSHGHDGPFAEAKELIGGYWLIQVRSNEEAVEWARRSPAADGEVIEIRQVVEISRLPDGRPGRRGRADLGEPLVR